MNKNYYYYYKLQIYGRLHCHLSTLPPRECCHLHKLVAVCARPHQHTLLPLTHCFVPPAQVNICMPILCQYYTNILPILHQYFANITPIFHQYFANISPIFCQYYINISPILLRYYSDISPILLQYFTNITNN